MGWTPIVCSAILGLEVTKMFTIVIQNPFKPKELEIIMGQIEELKSLLAQQSEVITDETSEIKIKIDELEAKIEELGGNQMPDISDIIDGVRSSIDKIEAISDRPVEEPPVNEPADAEPTTEEPTVEEPTIKEPVM